MLTSKNSVTSSVLPFLFSNRARNGISCGAEAKTSAVERPCSSAVIRVNGLNDEPGWRWPLVARLNGASWKSGPPTIARTAAVSLSSTTTEAVGSIPPSRLATIALDLALELEVEGRGDLEAAAERLAGAVAVDELLAQPGGEVRGLGVLLRRRDLVRASGAGSRSTSAYSSSVR